MDIPVNLGVEDKQGLRAVTLPAMWRRPLRNNIYLRVVNPSDWYISNDARIIQYFAAILERIK